jgi:twinkle protein
MLERKGDVLIADTWDEFNIDIPASKYHFAGDFKVRVCPECKASGKRHWNDSSLSINPAKGVANCHKCGSRFIIRQEEKKLQNKTFTPPSKKNLTPLSAGGLKYFTDRFISQESVIRHKVVERNGQIAFPYLFNGELVNIKYKGIVEKSYLQSPNGKHVMFNHDGAKAYMESSGDLSILITEGEEEVLAWDTAGVFFGTSVDVGAPNPNDKIEKKLECLTSSFDLFEMAETIYIGVDNDENGRRLERELIRRFPFEKVKLISYVPYKDGNDYLKFEGKEALRGLLTAAKDLKPEGIISSDDVSEDIYHMYTHGLTHGSTTYYPSIDKYWTIRMGEVTVGTGYNNEGKTALITSICINKAEFDEWPSAFYSPENLPAAEFFEDIIHTYIGKPMDSTSPFKMTKAELDRGMEFTKSKFFLVSPSEAKTLDALFERFDYLVRKYGVRIVVIDPLNQVEHLFNVGETIDMYMSRFMSKLKQFAVSRGVAVILIAHQNPPKTRATNGKDYPEPDIYTIKNGGAIGDKSDNVIVIWRPLRRSSEQDPLVKFISQKIKKKKLTGIVGDCDIYYDWKSNRYLDSLLDGRSPLDIKLAIPKEPPVEEKIDVLKSVGKQMIGQFELL